MATNEVKFTKYEHSGSMHWDEMTSRKYHKFNAYQQARFETVINWLGDVKGKKLIDLGCGDGALTYLLTKTGAQVTGIDNEPEGIKFAHEKFKNYNAKAEFILGDVRSTGMPAKSFDVVVSSDVIEHIERPEEMIEEAARLLIPGGVFIFTTPYRLTEQPGPYHVKEFFPSELVKICQPYFTDIQIKETHHIMWWGLYVYAVKHCKNRQLWRYVINLIVLWFKWNPFLDDDHDRTKRDAYSQINIKCIK